MYLRISPIQPATTIRKIKGSVNKIMCIYLKNIITELYLFIKIYISALQTKNYTFKLKLKNFKRFNK